MRSTDAVEEDRTARARIRDAAVHTFGTAGFDAPVRAVAAAAGVSPALVIHHFGSKDGLRAACDEHVLRVIREAETDAFAGPGGMLTQPADARLRPRSPAAPGARCRRAPFRSPRR
jgi:AcrR family transcriptional regulator